MNQLYLDQVVIKFKKFIETQKLPIHSIYLFGSRVKNLNHNESDYDFLVLLNDITDLKKFKNYKRKIIVQAHQEIPKTPMDILVKNVSEFESYKLKINTLYNTIYEEGILL